MCNPVQVGEIVWFKAGAASLRIKVVAVPFIADSPIEAVGLADVGVVIVPGAQLVPFHCNTCPLVAPVVVPSGEPLICDTVGLT